MKKLALALIPIVLALSFTVSAKAYPLPIEMACGQTGPITHYSYYYLSDNPDIPLAHSRDLMYMADSETGGTRVVGWHIWDTQANGDPCNTGHTWLRYTYNEFNWY